MYQSCYDVSEGYFSKVSQSRSSFTSRVRSTDRGGLSCTSPQCRPFTRPCRVPVQVCPAFLCRSSAPEWHLSTQAPAPAQPLPTGWAGWWQGWGVSAWLFQLAMFTCIVPAWEFKVIFLMSHNFAKRVISEWNILNVFTLSSERCFSMVQLNWWKCLKRVLH